MKNSKAVLTSTSTYQDIVDGKMPFYLCDNNADYKTDDDIVFIELDQDQQKESGRRCYAAITYLLNADQASIPPGFVLFAHHTQRQSDYIRDYDKLSNKILPEYEKLLSWKADNIHITDRINHVLHHLHATATDSIYKAKYFVEDVKVQFKALEIIMEGVTGQKNHTEKRVIANHVIEMLRKMIDKIDGFEWELTSGMHDRYNFFRSNSPEASLIKRYKDLKFQHEQLEQRFKDFSDKIPEEYKTDQLPF